jgi:hypothetical protein
VEADADSATATMRIANGFRVLARAVEGGGGGGDVGSLPETSSVPMDDLGSDWKHAAISQTDGGTVEEAAFEIPEDGGTDLGDNWTGADDKSANVHLGHDADTLYLEVVATDDNHNGVSGSGMWEGDTVQFAFAADGRSTYGPDYGLTHVDGSADIYQFQADNATAGVDAIEFSTDRSGDTTTYEAAIPWEAIFAEAPSAGDSFPFGLAVHENDGEWEGAITWSDFAIYTPKEPGRLTTATLMGSDTMPYKAEIDGTDISGTVTVGSDSAVEMTIDGSAVEDVPTVSLDDGVSTRTLTPS